jgi:GAF domain-containing protein
VQTFCSSSDMARELIAKDLPSLAIIDHAIADDNGEAILDFLRAADNPLVLGGPRIRFYAEYPLTLDDGNCIGTLCLLDTWPHTLKEVDLEQLRDLALIFIEQFQA